MAETDNPWKESLDNLYPLAMRFFLPKAAAGVDWTRDYEALENNLRPFLPESQTGLRFVDKLVKVWRGQTLEGEELEAGTQEEDYYHFEVQYQKEDGFEKRMSDYNDVARVHYRSPIISVAILGDQDPAWRPERYHWEREGCELTFKFHLIKLLDWRGQEQELFDHVNPFALFVLAHLLIHPTRNDLEQRAGWKLRLWRRACEHKMEEHDRATLVRLIDWMLLLPDERNKALRRRFSELREENPMPFISVFEQEILDQKQQLQDQKQQLQAKDQELRNSYLELIALALDRKYQTEGQALMATVQKQTDLDWLRQFKDRIGSASTLEDLRKLLP